MSLRKSSFLALAALCLYIGCTPVEKPEDDPVGPVEPEPVAEDVVNFYFGTSYIGLKPGESAELDIRYGGVRYDLEKNVAEMLYSSSDKSVVTVSTGGKLTAVSEGTAYISANSCNDETHKIPVRVYPEDFARYVNPTGDRLPVMGWHSLLPPYITHEQYLAMAQAGFNLSFSHVWTRTENTAALQAAAGTGVRLLLMDNDGHSISEIVDNYKDEPDFAGYWLADEPAVAATSSNATTIESVNQANREIRRKDRDHLTYVNLLPDYSSSKWWGVGSFSDYISTCQKSLEVNFLSYDYYPITSSGLRPTFFSCLETYKKVADEMGLPLWAFAMSCVHRTYPRPTPGHLRFEIYCALACGAQGIQYFTYQTPFNAIENFGDAPIDGQGNKTDIYEMAKTVNTGLAALSPVFLGASSVQRMYTTPMPSGVLSSLTYKPELLPAPLKDISGDGGGLLISHLCNGEKEYLVVVNRSWENSQTVTFDFEGELKMFLSDGTQRNVARQETLQSGDMVVICL